MVREKQLENEFFSRSEKSQGFMVGHENLERMSTLKSQENVSESENQCLQQLPENILFLFQEEGCTF